MVVAMSVVSCENPRPPGVCGSIPEQKVYVGARATVIACFDDPNDDMLTYTVTTSDQSVATAEASGSTVAAEGLAPGSALVTVTATDITGLKGEQLFRVVVPNRSPLAVGTIPSLQMPVGDSATVEVSGVFREPDGEVLDYEVALSDTSLAISVMDTVLTITARAKGTVTVTVTATDPGGLTAVQDFAVTVPNRVPVGVVSIPEQTVEVGGVTTHDLAAHFSDPDGDSLFYEAVASDTAVVRASSSQGIVSITAIAKGRAIVTVTATDAEGLAATLEFAVTVPNRPPLAVGVVPSDTVSVGDTTTLDLSAYFSDLDGDSLAYTVAIPDSTVALVSVAGSALTVTALSKGDAIATVTATDTEGLAAVQNFALTVPNRGPGVERSIPPRTIEAEDTAVLQLSSYFSDPDGDPLTFALVTSDTAVVAVSVSGSVATVTAIAKGDAIVTVTATDTEGLAAREVVGVNVPNRAPVVKDPMPPLSLAARDTATMELSPYISDPDGDSLFWAAAASDTAVVGVSVSESTVSVTVSVTATAKGETTVTVAATDEEGLAATLEFVVAVLNQAPMPVGSIEAPTLEAGDTLTLELSPDFSDADGDDLAFTAVTSDSTVVTVWVSGSMVTVAAVAQGEATVTVVATDTEGLTAAQEFTVTVPNRAPLGVGTFPSLRLNKGGVTRVDPSSRFVDPDNDSLVFETASSDLKVVRTWVSRDEILVRAVKKGSATVTITARDPEGRAAAQEFGVLVWQPGGSDANRPPYVVGSIPPQTLEEGDSTKRNVRAYFSDADGDDLDFTAASSDSGVVAAAVSGTEVMVRALAQGTATVTFTARDPDGLTATLDFSVTVSERSDVNRAPVAVGAIPPKILESGESTTVDVSSHFSDPDGDDLEFTVVTSRADVATVEVSGSEVTVVAVGDEGKTTVSVTAMDPGHLTASLDFEVVVGDFEIVSICDRTRAVRDEILNRIGASDCATAMDIQLAAVSRLDSDDITSVKPGDFAGLTGLIRLELGSNDLSVLPSNVFSGLSSLEVLHLSYNHLNSLPSGVFSGLTSLEELNVSHNGLTALPSGLFSGLSSLRFLFLDGNDIATLPPGVFSDLASLQILFLYGNDFTTVPAGVFSGLTSLGWITMEGGALNTLAAGTFAGLSSLARLDLSNNSLSALPPEIFSGAPGLGELLLSNNGLEELPDGIFHGLSSLQALWLHDNQVDPVLLEVSLVSAGGGRVKATVPAGAPFAIEVPLIVNNSTSGPVTIPVGEVESAPVTVTSGGAVSVDVGALPDPPTTESYTSYRGETHPAHHGYKLTRSPDLPLTVGQQDQQQPLPTMSWVTGVHARSALQLPLGVAEPGGRRTGVPFPGLSQVAAPTRWCARWTRGARW